MADPNRLSPENAATLGRYYERVNVGDFMGAVETLSPDITFEISGNPTLLPFSGTWEGRDAVLDLFQRFGAAFRIVDMSETRSISDRNQVFSFNDESFKVSGTGSFYRVPVVHHTRFEGGLMTRLHNIHDTYTAEQAFAGADAIALPMVNGAPLDGEADVADARAEEIVRSFLGQLAANASPADLLADDMRVLAPGARSRLPFGGVWLGKEEALTFFDELARFIPRTSMRVEEVVAVGGAVAVSVVDTVEIAATGAQVDAPWIALVQLDGSEKIGRLSLYLDTPAIGVPWSP